jgi:succinoglycan biosynthesis protein ExoU
MSSVDAPASPLAEPPDAESHCAAADTKASVDVIIAAWNRSATIERAIGSVIDGASVRSIVVVDDASTDDTAEKVERLAGQHKRVRLIRNGSNRGPSAARNRAIEASDAPWIAILDADDFMAPDRLDRLIAESEGWDFVADEPLQVKDGEAPRILSGLSGFAGSRIDLATFVSANIGRRGRLRRELGFVKPLMRRAFLEEHSLRYDETVRLGEDYLLYARALAEGARFRLVPPAGYIALLRSDSLSARHSRRDLEALREGDRALLAIPSLTATERMLLERHCRQLDGKIQWLEVIEAVKGRDPLRFIGGFAFSPSVAGYVTIRLAEQLWFRTAALFGHDPGARHGG